MVPRGRVACGTSWTNVCPLIAFRSVRTAVGRRGNMLMKMRPALSILIRSTYILLLTMKRTSGSVAQKHLFCGAGNLASWHRVSTDERESIPLFARHVARPGILTSLHAHVTKSSWRSILSRSLCITHPRLFPAPCTYETEHKIGRLFWPYMLRPKCASFDVAYHCWGK